MICRNCGSPIFPDIRYADVHSRNLCGKRCAKEYDEEKEYRLKREADNDNQTN